jgi:hypothetical protein
MTLQPIYPTFTRPRRVAPVLAWLLLPCLLLLVLRAPGWAWPLLGAPLLEEIVFRAGLQAWLQDRLAVDHSTNPGTWLWRAGLANALTGLAFAAAHAAVRPSLLSALTLLPALLLGAVYQRTRRLRDCVVLHASFNAVWLMAAPALYHSAFLHRWMS